MTCDALSSCILILTYFNKTNLRTTLLKYPKIEISISVINTIIYNILLFGIQAFICETWPSIPVVSPSIIFLNKCSNMFHQVP